MTEDRACEDRPGLVQRVRTPAGDPAWQVSGYREIKQLLMDPRLGRSHPQPQQASRYSNSAFIGLPRSTDPETERAESARFRWVLSRSFSGRRMEVLRPRVLNWPPSCSMSWPLRWISTSMSRFRYRYW